MKRLRSLLLVGLVAVAACGEPAQGPAIEGGPPPETPPATTEAELPGRVNSLAGEWRVAGIDGLSLDEPVGLSLTGTDQQLWWEPRCAGMARTYRIEGRRVTFGPTETRTPGSPPPPVCAIAVGPRVHEVFRALDGAVSIVRTENNGVLISGPDHSVILFTQ